MDKQRTAAGETANYPKQMVVFSKDGHWKPRYYTVLSRVEERLFRSWAYFKNQHVVVRPMRKEVENV